MFLLAVTVPVPVVQFTSLSSCTVEIGFSSTFCDS